MTKFFVAYWKNGFRRWANFVAASEQQVRDSIAQCQPEWEIIRIDEC